jgi:CheY-like chemotaxis protein
LLCCRQAAEFIFDGQYEEAREALGEFWRGVGNRPSLEGLSSLVTAEVLLQCGALTGRFGSSRNIAGAQEAAKDLLSEALGIFQKLARSSKVSEVHYELGICYWRLGALGEARVVLDEALRGLSEADAELKAKILIRRTLIEISARRYYEAWNILNEAEPVFETTNDAWKGRWHNQKALVLLHLITDGRQTDYADRAIIEFTAAIFHYEQAKHERFCGNSLNNFAFLLYKLARYAESHEHLDRARNIFTRLKDTGSTAQVDETRARVFAAEGRYAEANNVIAGAVAALREGGEQALLADALVVWGGVQARLGEYDASVSTLTEAISVAETAGALESAGHAALSLVEEHGRSRLSEDEVIEAYRRADELLARTQDADDVARLRACARVALSRLSGGDIPAGFSLPRTVRAHEARFIERALAEENGSISRAARRLGVKHQSLAHILQTRHKGLSDARTPAVPRKRSIIRVRHPRAAARYETPRAIRPVVIMHVEDNRLVADAVKETLEMEGWQVEVCLDGSTAVARIEGEEHFDLLLLDSDLPDMSGLDVARRARQLPHRRGLPVVILSGSDCAADARRAGVDAFLKKPGGMKSLVETLTRLLDGPSRPPTF